MFKNTTELAENKLLLLYIFDKLNIPLSNSHITQIILENNLIDYFSLQQYLSELIESGFIKDTKEDKWHMLTITSRGKDVLEFFYNRIPESKKDTIDKYINSHISSIKKDIEVFSEYEPLGNSRFMVNLKLREGEDILIDLKLPASSNDEARHICGVWKKNYKDIYDKLMDFFK
ncbi:DUF4364 family protein [Fonticella tunisiensis]|uniref:Uncharacterized protein DUF4364 n=1 Tax=Fonticella tunisiensis TaxID=1096341 RepID=A0A4R7KQT3_9CLOT|nr:DUF4364 family protein [Fonticella tunisiensis]TDT61076.1 uncharacterized protein DUF4364 [Fonticella tunisiensis]